MICVFESQYNSILAAEQEREQEAARAQTAKLYLEDQAAKEKAARLRAQEEDRARNLVDISIAQDKCMNMYIVLCFIVHFMSLSLNHLLKS